MFFSPFLVLSSPCSSPLPKISPILITIILISFCFLMFCISLSLFLMFSSFFNSFKVFRSMLHSGSVILVWTYTPNLNFSYFTDVLFLSLLISYIPSPVSH